MRRPGGGLVSLKLPRGPMRFRLPFTGSAARRRAEDAARALYDAIVAQARQPGFYLDLGVPDSLDGRFDLIVLHAHLTMRGLGRREGEGGRHGTGFAPESARAVSQALFDLMFADMDQSLREMGVTDSGVGKRVKQMAQAFYGRVLAYDTGLADAEDAALIAALRRNLFRAVDNPDPAALTALASYLRAQDRALAGAEGLVEGRVAFAPPPVAA